MQKLSCDFLTIVFLDSNSRLLILNVLAHDYPLLTNPISSGSQMTAGATLQPTQQATAISLFQAWMASVAVDLIGPIA